MAVVLGSVYRVHVLQSGRSFQAIDEVAEHRCVGFDRFRLPFRMIEARGIKDVGYLVELTELARAVIAIRKVDGDPRHISRRRRFAGETDHIPFPEREQMIGDTASDQAGSAGDECSFLVHAFYSSFAVDTKFASSIKRSAGARSGSSR